MGKATADTLMTQLEYGIGGSLQGIEDASGHHLTGLEFWWSPTDCASKPVCLDVSRGSSLGPVFRNLSSASLAEVACGLHRKLNSVVGLASAISSLFSLLISSAGLVCWVHLV